MPGIIWLLRSKQPADKESPVGQGSPVKPISQNGNRHVLLTQLRIGQPSSVVDETGPWFAYGPHILT